MRLPALLTGAPPVLVALLPVLWALDVQQILGLGLFPEQIAGVIMGAACAAVYLGGTVRIADLILAAASDRGRAAYLPPLPGPL